jgi:hypothetical protein
MEFASFSMRKFFTEHISLVPQPSYSIDIAHGTFVYVPQTGKYVRGKYISESTIDITKLDVGT